MSTIRKFKNSYQRELFARYDEIISTDEFDFPISSDQILYHYTTTEGILGILKKGLVELRFSRYDCLNDRDEGQEMLVHYREACLILLKKERINNDFFDSIVNLQPSTDSFFVHRTNDNDTPRIEKKGYDAYICCFSRDGDSLDLWRYYMYNGKLQGYNIGFCSWIFDEIEKESLLIHEKPSKCCELRLCQVLYNDDEKIEYFCRKIMAGYELMQMNGYKMEEIIPLLESQLLYTRFVFKHKCFCSEKEIRAIMLIPKETFPNMKDEMYEIKYRSREGIIIPYIEIRLKMSVNVRIITVSPLVHENTAEKTLKEYLSYNGFNIVRIKKSILPIRY